MRALRTLGHIVNEAGGDNVPFFLEERVGAACEATGRKLARSSGVDGASWREPFCPEDSSAARGSKNKLGPGCLPSNFSSH